MFFFFFLPYPFLFFHLGLNEGVDCHSSNGNGSSNTSLSWNLVTCKGQIVGFGTYIRQRRTSKSKKNSYRRLWLRIQSQRRVSTHFQRHELEEPLSLVCLLLSEEGNGEPHVQSSCTCNRVIINYCNLNKMLPRIVLVTAYLYLIVKVVKHSDPKEI